MRKDLEVMNKREIVKHLQDKESKLWDMVKRFDGCTDKSGKYLYDRYLIEWVAIRDLLREIGVDVDADI